jgi:hypothetical protein
MCALVRFSDSHTKICDEIFVVNYDIGKDLINWITRHPGTVFHKSVIFRLYAQNKYGPAYQRRVACGQKIFWEYDVFDKNGSIIIKSSNHVTGIIIEGIPQVLKKFL